LSSLKVKNVNTTKEIDLIIVLWITSIFYTETKVAITNQFRINSWVDVSVLTRSTAKGVIWSQEHSTTSSLVVLV